MLNSAIVATANSTESTIVGEDLLLLLCCSTGKGLEHDLGIDGHPLDRSAVLMVEEVDERQQASEFCFVDKGLLPALVLVSNPGHVGIVSHQCDER